MQNRINNLFYSEERKILSLFFTAGFPKLNDTLKILAAIDKADVDLIEIGIPFSDPLADGETIQKANSAALGNGMSLKLLFKQLEGLRNHTQKPILLMGYLNSVLQFGITKFYEACENSGIDGIILPDLPIEEFETEHKALSKKHNVNVVFLISPLTDQKRIRKIDACSNGFLYLVSSNSTTGQKAENFIALNNSLEKIKALQLKNPILIGFGIKDAKTFRNATELSNGAIIGSEFLKRIECSRDFEMDTKKFVNEILKPNYDNSIKN